MSIKCYCTKAAISNYRDLPHDSATKYWQELFFWGTLFSRKLYLKNFNIKNKDKNYETAYLGILKEVATLLSVRNLIRFPHSLYIEVLNIYN